MLERYGHEATDVRDIGLGSAKDPLIAAYAQTHQVCLLTGDFGFADIRNYVPAAYAGLVVLELPRNTIASFIVRLVESLLQQPEVVAENRGEVGHCCSGQGPTTPTVNRIEACVS